MLRHVWLFTRPLKVAVGISSLESTSDPERPYLRHWGVLVTETTIPEIRFIIQTANPATSHELRVASLYRLENFENMTLGVMYELQRKEKLNDCLIDENFTMDKVREKWGNTFAAQYVSETTMSHEDIKEEGTRIIRDRPTYKLFENNCQNFAKFLLEQVCPGAPVPETVQAVLEQLTRQYATSRALPGTYPR